MDTIIDSTRFEVALSNRESTELAGTMWSGFGFSAVMLSLLTAYPFAAIIENAKPAIGVDEGVAASANDEVVDDGFSDSETASTLPGY